MASEVTGRGRVWRFVTVQIAAGNFSFDTRFVYDNADVDCSSKTVRNTLNEMCKLDILKPVGSTSNRTYSATENAVDIFYS